MVQNTLKTSLGSLMTESNSSATTSGATTPVLTPTTLKCITQLFEAEDCLDKLQTIENDGFVVPLPPGPAAKVSNKKSFFKLENSHSWQGGTATVVTPTKSEHLTILDLPEEATPLTVNSAALTTMKTRSSSRPRAGAQPQVQIKAATSRKHAVVKRTPAKSRPGVKANHDESDLSPDEVERLRIRRERNKAAAARCRKRRMDQISTLSEEVAVHEEKKRILEQTIAQLRAEKEDLEFVLTQHQNECKFGDQYMMIPSSVSTQSEDLPVAVKSEPVLVQTIDQAYLASTQEEDPLVKRVLKPKRPLTLTIEAPRSTVEGVVIETPSNVVTSLGFDSLMTSTGLTPTTNIITPVFSLSTPTCSSQQRTSEMSSLADLNTPNNENVSLVSL